MKRTFLLIIIFLAYISIYAQSINTKNTFTILSYNVENLFDTINNPKTADDEFLPQSKKNWNTKKYFAKINNIAKVIKSIHPEENPEIIALLEIENRKVLEDLILKTSLKKSGYKIIHYESRDPRGIDVALLYLTSEFTVLKSNPIKISYKNEENQRTRDILYVKGLTNITDTLHIFVNHWKSRREKDEETELKRIFEAKVLRQKVDSIMNTNNMAKIIILGDFNDEPTNISLSETLKAGNKKENPSANELYNLMYDKKTNGEGSYFFYTEWMMLDNIIVSYPLLNKLKLGYHANFDSGKIFKADWMMSTNKEGIKYPKKSYIGNKFNGGISDHLPVYIELIK